MADHKIMIPFILHFAAGVYGKNGSDLLRPHSEQFEIARKTGWSDDPDDPGGATMIDVTLSTFKEYRRLKGLPSPTKADLRRISFLEWTEILKTMYWDKWHADRIVSQGIANILVDWVWASGASSIRSVQRMLGVRPDGIAGPVTIHAINASEAESLFFSIRDAREAHFRKCRAAWKYLAGWLRRLNALRPDGSFRIQGTPIGRLPTRPDDKMK